MRGFTFIEILVSVALISIMGTLVISLINPAFQLEKARDAQRKADLRQIQAALELYRADQGSYPASLTCGAALTNPPPVTATYLRKIPCDPKNTGQYRYTYTTSAVACGVANAQYCIITCLENQKDPQKDAIDNATYCSGGSTNWSYTAVNP